MQRLGIIAGGGSLPRKLVSACRRNGQDFFVVGFKGQTDKETSPHVYARLGAVDETIALLKAQGVDTLVMAGYIRRPSLAEIRPDFRTLQIFAKLGVKAFGDDALLRGITAELENEGFKVIGAHEIEPDLVTPAGILGKIKPNTVHQTDIDTGIRIGRSLGALDIGQSVIVQQSIVLGVEAVEGTDELIRRCRALKRKGQGGVLVKVCKPQQDKRLDMPVIGIRTVRNAYEAGLEGIALEAGASVILDREEVVDAADKLGLFIVGFSS